MVAYARAHVYRNASLEIETVEYANQHMTARLIPETTRQTLTTASPTGTIVDTSTPVWTFQLVGIEDAGTGAMWKAITDAAAAGTNLDVVLQPRVGTGQDVATFTLVPEALPFGGQVGEFRTFDHTFGVQGQPVFTQSA